ncbi:hypothetical protein TCELL_1032 [Thermogladius calderae 1633]|uniref:Uncharacterized protein n=1 Tax=Thermogladius calderae (strain DSM 22663 / VKM B-2946 / 1633) TaxID=1184251 RepID=I3TFB7_THEC1|nr:hypothetical protein [Thermogladius calderae]AFK51455.1 hypothetical protein TCELL_1032 [Thermogladius calderae 1633]
MATASSGTVSPEEDERLKERLAEAAVSALDAGLELAKWLYVFEALHLWGASKTVGIRFLDGGYVEVDFCSEEGCLNILSVEGTSLVIDAKSLCQLMGLDDGVCKEWAWYPRPEYSHRLLVGEFFDVVHKMARRGLLDKLVELLDAALERAERGEYQYDGALKEARIIVPTEGDPLKTHRGVAVIVGTEDGGRETAVERLRWVRDLVKTLRDFSRRLSESGLVDRVADGVLEGALRRVGEVVESMAQDRGALEKLVRDAVGRQVDFHLYHFKYETEHGSIKIEELARSAVSPFYDYEYAVSLPDGEVKRGWNLDWTPRSWVKLGEVEFPDVDSLADLVVEAVRPSHEAPTSSSNQPPAARYEMVLELGECIGGHDPRDVKPYALLRIGGISLAALVPAKGRDETEVYLVVSGLTALGLAEKVRPGTTREVLRKPEEAVKERLRDAVVTELFYSLLREQYGWQGPGA